MTLEEKISQMAQIDKHQTGIPMLYKIDSMHGHNSLYKATLFPTMSALGKLDPELVKRIGVATTVCRDPRWGRCYESYSEDHKIVEQMTEIINGLQGEIPPNSRKDVSYIGGRRDKVAACAKNFVGDGRTIHGIDENNTVIDWHELLSIHMPGYYHSIIKGVATVMVSYSSWNSEKVHGNKNLITNFLKGTLNFKTFFSHFFASNSAGICHFRLDGVDRMTYLWSSNYSNSLLTAINAAIDVVSILFEWPLTYMYLCRYRSKSLTDGTTAGITILNAVSTAVDPSTEIVYSENPDDALVKANSFSYAIVVVGEPPYAEGSGDNLNLTIPEPGLRTMTNVCRSTKCIVVLISGRSIVIEPYLSSINALVAAWLPRTEGQAVADVLFGDYGFTGKLPRTWFKTVDQLPMNVGDKHYDPLFPFGFGLTTKPIGSS
ncbi:hypothetical protein BUALT_Bualt16G0077700 [Buddleja alternifolia]|uniref:Glycoside hydrolase family 3 C-terminal domain-containing protein n=1 Tax=Buddleja alternifolia TaxID=168488 RepID=A0AAV6WKQ7_9LAMI|nr:hypothetical protein BUALT_Bualt16G0077700 [Buddleja alternifolia]